MTFTNPFLHPVCRFQAAPTETRAGSGIAQPRRSAPYGQEPGYYEPAGLWFYGNVRLLHGELARVTEACGRGVRSIAELRDIESKAEELVLQGKVLVCGIHNTEHQYAAVVPLRWGAPRIVVFSGGIRYHLGSDLKQEPFRAGRLWRFCWDPMTDLAVSRRAPDRKPTYASDNPTVDRLIARLCAKDIDGLKSPLDSLTPIAH